MPNLKPCVKSSQLSVTVPYVPSVSPPATSVRNNVISKPVTYCDSLTSCLLKFVRKSTIVKKS